MFPSRTALLVGLIVAAAGCSGAPRPLPTHWRAWLDSPGGPLPFGLELDSGDHALRAYLINGAERAPIEQVTLTGDRLVMKIAPYDSELSATLSSDRSRLDGSWSKTIGADRMSRLEFHALAGAHPRFPEPSSPDGSAVDGRWEVRFESDATPAVGIFAGRSDGTVHGTFLTATGDYRYLEGTFDDGRLLLSCFDGAHAFLFNARLREDGTLSGDFWSRDTWHETWTARRDPEARLPDAFELTAWVGGSNLAEVELPDLEGRPRSLADPAFSGRARILEIFGTWCPNCNDATRTLVELDRKYRDRGLSILGLAFEVTGDPARDTAQVRRWIEHHDVQFPVLLAGVSDKEEASRTFPLLDRIRSYPTTVFLHGDGRVRAVHQGFTGPATGAAHDELVSRFESLIEEILAEGVHR